jgi:Cro/C1-type HTH DNA-binding domain
MIGVYGLFIGRTVYVGASSNLEKKIKGHIWALKNDRHGNKKLQAAFNAVGTLESKVLEEANAVSELENLERKWAEELGSVDSRVKYSHTIKSASSIKWNLRNLLERLGVSPYRLAQEMGIASSSIYRLLRGDGPELLNGKMIGKILDTLQAHSPKPLVLGDLLVHEKKQL